MSRAHTYRPFIRGPASSIMAVRNSFSLHCLIPLTSIYRFVISDLRERYASFFYAPRFVPLKDDIISLAISKKLQ